MADQETKTRPNQVIYWDDSHIEAEAVQFPAPIREPYTWLKTFAREDCKRDVDVLVAKFRDVGVTIDKTNWVRVLKGRWKKDAYGNEIQTPHIAADNLLRAIKALREQVRVELLEGRMPFIETSTYKTIAAFVRKKMRKDRVNRFGVITGPTGTQKTASFKELSRVVPKLKWIESADNGSIKEFTIRLAVKFGATKTISYSNARSLLFDVVGPDHCIVVDNMQTMIRSRRELEKMGKAEEVQPAYQFIRTLQDECDCTVIWSITPESEEQMFDAKSIYLEQFEGRTGGRDGFLRLPNHPPAKDLILIAEALGFKNAAQHGALLSEIAKGRGRIRRFFEIMQDAKDAADADNAKLTADYLQEAIDERTNDQPAKKEGGK